MIDLYFPMIGLSYRSSCELNVKWIINLNVNFLWQSHQGERALPWPCALLDYRLASFAFKPLSIISHNE